MSREQRPRALLAWSSGKDSAWALHLLRQAGEVEVVALLTTFNQEFDRVAMHGVRRELVSAQSSAVGLPLIDVQLPWPCSNTDYEVAMSTALAIARAEYSVSHVAFGDLFLEEVRQYRESRLRSAGLVPLFPLWGISTIGLARQMVAAGLGATVTCVDPQQLGPQFAGREFDNGLLDDLPEAVDPCGERGEFHTFAHSGPMFSRPIATRTGGIAMRDGFVFADLLHPDPTKP